MAPTTSSKDGYLIRGVCGGLSSMTAEIFTFPIDTIKVRLQLQRKQATARVFSDNLITNMLKKEGAFSLWKGIYAALARQAVYSSGRMAMYEPIRNILGSSDTIWNKIVAGGVGGAIGAALANPADIIKIRLQADTSGKLYSGVINALSVIVRTEGFRGLINGIAPNTQRAFLVNAAELSTYDHAKHHLKQSGYFQEGVLLHGMASFCAGFAAACASTPADVIKTRMMQQQFGTDGKGLLYTGTIDCVKKTVREEGALALYKGFFPTWLRIGPWAMIMFITFEKLRSFAEFSTPT